jgi:hypothetical protein
VLCWMLELCGCHCCDEAFLKWCSIYWNPMYHSYDCEI